MIFFRRVRLSKILSVLPVFDPNVFIFRLSTIRVGIYQNYISPFSMASKRSVPPRCNRVIGCAIPSNISLAKPSMSKYLHLVFRKNSKHYRSIRLCSHTGSPCNSSNFSTYSRKEWHRAFGLLNLSSILDSLHQMRISCNHCCCCPRRGHFLLGSQRRRTNILCSRFSSTSFCSNNRGISRTRRTCIDIPRSIASQNVFVSCRNSSTRSWSFFVWKIPN